jgi:prepilin-type N-terminal cleavage/methylation domain-containing protein
MQAAGNTYPQDKDGIRGKDGFTLVEVIISMVLMAIVFTAAFGAYFLGMRMVEDAREELRASQIIQSELEALRSLNWGDLDDLPSMSPVNPQGSMIQQFAKNYIAYRQVTSIDATKKRVIVYVWWINSRGVYTYQIANTIFTKRGLNDYYYRKV